MNTRKKNVRKMNARKLLVSVLMLVSVLLSACQTQTTPPVATIVPATVAPTTAPVSSLTTFSPKAFKLPMGVSLGSQWKVAEDYPDVISLVSDDYYVDLAFILVKDIKLADPKNSFAPTAFPDDFATWIQEHGLFPDVQTQPVVVAGFQGTEINSIVTSDCGDKKNWLFLQSTGWNCRAGEYYHFIYLEDVYGERVLIMNTGGDASEEDFNLGVEAAQKVLDTVVFSQP